MKIALALGVGSIVAGLVGLIIRGQSEGGWPDPHLVVSFGFYFFLSPTLAVMSAAATADAINVGYRGIRRACVILFGAAFLSHSLLYISGYALYDPSPEELAQPLRGLGPGSAFMLPCLYLAFALAIFAVFRINDSKAVVSVPATAILAFIATVGAVATVLPTHVLGPIAATAVPLVLLLQKRTSALT